MIDVRPGRPGWAEVTFRHPGGPDDALAVAGDFTQWAPRALSPDPDAADHHRLTVEIPIGRRYQFRYVRGGETWENDWGADDYVANAHGGEDSVLDLGHDGPHHDRLGIADSRVVRTTTGRHEAADGDVATPPDAGGPGAARPDAPPVR